MAGWGKLSQSGHIYMASYGTLSYVTFTTNDHKRKAVDSLCVVTVHVMVQTEL